MKKACIIVDIDNTLIDTAHRKQKILKDNFSKDIELSKIRDDFELKLVFVNEQTNRTNFFQQLDSENGIRNFPAPLFPLAKETIDSLNNEGIDILFLTARPEILKSVTIKELQALKIDTSVSPIYFKSDEYSSDSNTDYKSKVIKNLGEQYFIITLIGDRLEDINAATQNHIPSILLTSTTQPSEIINAGIANDVGFQSCSDWKEVALTIKLYIAGSKEVVDFRKQMIDLYSGWLKDIDSKLSVCVAISGILCGLTATILFRLSAESLIENIQLGWILCIFLSALTALVFAIRGITSRVTSSAKSGQAVKIEFKQCLSILFDRNKNKSLQDDAISDFEQFKNYNTIQKVSAHRRHFYKQYKTHDTDVWWNYRFFSVRAANYSKLYGERFASKFLMIAIVLLGLWVSLATITRVFRLDLNTTTDKPTKIEATKKIDEPTKVEIIKEKN